MSKIYSRILGTGSYLPDQLVTNADLAEKMQTSDEWITQRTGIAKRYIAADNQYASDLALHAANRALEMAGISADQLNLIIVATTTPDMVFPGTACILQAKLGAHGMPAFDVQAVCSGFVYGLSIADQFMRSGQYEHILVVGAEVFSRLVDWRDRSTCVLFGDGAGAVVLKRSATPGIITSALHADGRHAGILSVPGCIQGGSISGRPVLQMDGAAVFKFAVQVLEEVSREVLSMADMDQSSIDWLIPHQANIRIIQATAKKLSLPMDRVITTVDKHANTSAASIPLALDVAVRDGRIQQGQHIMLAAVGGGFTWGAVLLQW